MQPTQTIEGLIPPPPWLPAPVIDVSRMEQDASTRLRCQEFLSHVIATKNLEVEWLPKEEQGSLQESLEQAAKGDEQALLSSRANVKIAVVEAFYKAGHITEIRSTIDDAGKPSQYGQTHTSVYRNALIYGAQPSSEITERTEVETLNGHRFEDLYQEGFMDEYWVVEPSFFPDNTTLDVAKEAGFYADTMTGVLRGTTTQDGEYLTQSAFVKGAADGENENEKRYDLATIKKAWAILGVDVSKANTTELLARPVLIPKIMMPHGIASAVELFDACASEEIDKPMFFGVAGRNGDYATFIDECRERENELDALVDTILSELISRRTSIKSPGDAVQMLANLVKVHGVEYSIHEESIDEKVFGSVAATHINQARQHVRSGNDVLARQALNMAQRTAIISMCGIGTKSQEDKSSDDPYSSEYSPDSIGEQSVLKCVTCPLCKKTGVDAHISQTASHKTITCSSCKKSKTYEK